MGSERWRVDGNPAEGCRRRGDAMELFEALYTTRAMRRMSAREVPDELIPRVLDAAIRAPSGGGFQNWCFIVIRDPTMKAYLGELFREDVAAARRGRYRPLEEAIGRGERSERLDAHAAFVRSMLHRRGARVHRAPHPVGREHDLAGRLDLPRRLEPAARGPRVRARQRPRRKPRPAPGRAPSAPRRAGGRRLDAREHRRAGVPDRTLGRGAATACPRRGLPRAVG